MPEFPMTYFWWFAPHQLTKIKEINMIIGIVGKEGSGKSTLAEYLVREYNYKELAFATEIKETCIRNRLATREELYANNKTSGIRWLMLGVGDLFRNEISPDYWINKLHSQFTELINQQMAEYHSSSFLKIVISDVRLLSEADYVRKSMGILIRIDRKLDNVSNYHLTETEQDDIPVDYILYNNGTIEDLYISLKETLGLWRRDIL
jgi:dephospho-CoA kinase